MAFVTIDASLCLRKDADSAGDGYFFVNHGIVTLNHKEKLINIYEKETFLLDGYDSTPALQINLVQRNALKIKFKTIYSSHYNCKAGKVVLTGVFDRGKEEIVTIKISNIEDYKLLAKSLKKNGN
jgi:hypothetical protein|tara:strand:+ start:356 stop:730 length:375 start_codon:yes stop_codon:yes gene_type:complete